MVPASFRPPAPRKLTLRSPAPLPTSVGSPEPPPPEHDTASQLRPTTATRNILLLPRTRVLSFLAALTVILRGDGVRSHAGGRLRRGAPSWHTGTHMARDR